MLQARTAFLVLLISTIISFVKVCCIAAGFVMATFEIVSCARCHSFRLGPSSKDNVPRSCFITVAFRA